ncbi:MAG: hypothetical protein RJA29_1303 [Pseudomonadota bacterium]
MPIRHCLPFSLAGSLLVLLGGPLPVLAQGEPTPAQLSKQFGEGFLKGCLASKVAGIKSQAGYCTWTQFEYHFKSGCKTRGSRLGLGHSDDDARSKGVCGFQMMFAPESGWSRFAQDCIVRSVLLDAYCASVRIPHN